MSSSTCLGLRKPTIAPSTAGFFNVQATATAPGVLSSRVATFLSRSTSARCRESYGSLKRSLCLRQSSEGRLSIRSRVIAPVSRPEPIGE